MLLTIFNVSGDYKVALLDAGVKLNIARLLAERNCKVRVFPYGASYEEMQNWQP